MPYHWHEHLKREKNPLIRLSIHLKTFPLGFSTIKMSFLLTAVVSFTQGVTKNVRLSLLTNSAQMRGKGGSWRNEGVSANEYSCVHHVTWSPNKLWISTSLFNIWWVTKWINLFLMYTDRCWPIFEFLKCLQWFSTIKINLFLPVYANLRWPIMLVAYFCQSPLIKGRVDFNNYKWRAACH
jgi:hypothetical protein